MRSLVVQMAYEKERRQTLQNLIPDGCPNCGNTPTKVVTCKRRGSFFWRCAKCKYRWK